VFRYKEDCNDRSSCLVPKESSRHPKGPQEQNQVHRVKRTAQQVTTTASRKWITRFVVSPSVSNQIDCFLSSPVRIGVLYKPTKWVCYWSNIHEIQAPRFYRDFVCAQYYRLQLRVAQQVSCARQATTNHSGQHDRFYPASIGERELVQEVVTNLNFETSLNSSAGLFHCRVAQVLGRLVRSGIAPRVSLS
jgi:hypothetical protein